MALIQIILCVLQLNFEGLDSAFMLPGEVLGLDELLKRAIVLSLETLTRLLDLFDLAIFCAQFVLKCRTGVFSSTFGFSLRLSD